MEKPRQIPRAEVASRLGCTVRWLRMLQGKGSLVGKRRRDGSYWYDTEEVEAFARAQSIVATKKAVTGRVAARVYELRSQGLDVAAIVIASRQHPDIVRRLVAEYQADVGGLVLDAEQLAAIRAPLERAGLGWDGSAAGLVLAVGRLAELSEAGSLDAYQAAVCRPVPPEVGSAHGGAKRKLGHVGRLDAPARARRGDAGVDDQG